VNGETLDAFYHALRMCREHCGGRAFTQHRTSAPHDCDERCGAHRCTPLAEATIRQVHDVFATAVLPSLPITRSPSQCPGTARPSTSAGRSSM